MGFVTPARAGDWDCNTGLYMWLSGLDGTMGFGPVNDVPVSAKFTDIASYLDFAFAGYFEARQTKYILQTDLSFVNLGASRSAHINGSTVDVSLDMKQYIGELAGAYRVTPDFDLWLAGRLYSLKTAQTFQGSDLRTNSYTWGDVYVGARYHREFAEKWVAGVRADIGTGGSDLAWFGNANVGYHFTPTFTLGVGYRVLSLDYTNTDNGYFKYDIVQDGVGIVLDFALK
jgi:hypothetical protein